MDLFDKGIGKISVCTGFMDSITDIDSGLPAHRNERRNEMKEQNQNKKNYSNKNDSNKYENTKKDNQNKQNDYSDKSSNKNS
ncbi:MAG: hypothetical protein IJ408_02750 [Clostridia bacterium]|nr:hypothetical protein [Clostridia bacterium]